MSFVSENDLGTCPPWQGRRRWTLAFKIHYGILWPILLVIVRTLRSVMKLFVTDSLIVALLSSYPGRKRRWNYARWSTEWDQSTSDATSSSCQSSCSPQRLLEFNVRFFLPFFLTLLESVKWESLSSSEIEAESEKRPKQDRSFRRKYYIETSNYLLALPKHLKEQDSRVNNQQTGNVDHPSLMRCNKCMNKELTSKKELQLHQTRLHINKSGSYCLGCWQGEVEWTSRWSKKDSLLKWDACVLFDSLVSFDTILHECASIERVLSSRKGNWFSSSLANRPLPTLSMSDDEQELFSSMFNDPIEASAIFTNGSLQRSCAWVEKKSPRPSVYAPPSI